MHVLVALWLDCSDELEWIKNPQVSVKVRVIYYKLGMRLKNSCKQVEMPGVDPSWVTTTHFINSEAVCVDFAPSLSLDLPEPFFFLCGIFSVNFANNFFLILSIHPNLLTWLLITYGYYLKPLQYVVHCLSGRVLSPFSGSFFSSSKRRHSRLHTQPLEFSNSPSVSVTNCRKSFKLTTKTSPRGSHCLEKRDSNPIPRNPTHPTLFNIILCF